MALSSSLYNPRRHVGIHAEHVSHISNAEFPGHYPGEDHSWNLETFKEVSSSEKISSIAPGDSISQGQKLQVKVQRLSQRSIDFDLVGVDASIANAFRRIVIAEVCLISTSALASFMWFSGSNRVY
jgi:DNA-directed RNA polymerases I and III subunit RPAC1